MVSTQSWSTSRAPDPFKRCSGDPSTCLKSAERPPYRQPPRERMWLSWARSFRGLILPCTPVSQIKQISDLRSKTLVSGTVGGNTYFAALLFLSRFNWVPNRDVNVIGVGGSPEVLGALTQGRFPAGVLTAPTTHMATRMGFREIFDLGSLDFPFPTLSVVSTRKYIEANPDAIMNILRATSEAIYLYRTRPEVTLPVIAKYMRVPKDDPALLQAQETFAKHLNLNLTPSLDGIKFILDFLAEQRPGVK